MEGIVLALLPIFLLILLGYFFKRIEFPNKDFWAQADKFTYYVLFPSLLIYKLSTAKLENIDGFAFVSSALLTVVLITFILVILNKFLLFFNGTSFTSVYQGAVRFNTYVFLALVSTLYGDTGLVLAAFLITFLIPSLNIFCIAIFSFYTPSQKITIKSFMKSIVTNPLIVACVFGGGLNYFSLDLGVYLTKTLEILSSAALPLGLLSVGVGLQIGILKDVKFELFVSVFVKLLLFPFLIFIVGKFLGVENLALTILVLFSAMPTASSAYILARQLGGDLKLMSAIITMQTLLSALTISLVLLFI